jgi:TIR domain
MPSKPIVFLSHIHEDANIANLLEKTIKETLLGAVDVFNTSGRTSLRAGDPWADKILASLRSCVAALIIATPDSVRSPWVNFESGAAWVSKKRVIPCCAGGMTKGSLPAPLNSLQALELTQAGDLSHLFEQLAKHANLDSPATVDYDDLARQVAELAATPEATNDSDFLNWVEMASLRPAKYRGQSRHGVFSVSYPRVVTPTQADQFPGITAGESVQCWVKIPGRTGTLYHCFASGDDADIVAIGEAEFEGELVCLGQLKSYDTDTLNWEHEDRGISYDNAFQVRALKALGKSTD